MIPLHLRLKKKAHQIIAYAQDLMMEEVYHFFPEAVLHGGTDIWRCYRGNRFSEDIDIYLASKGSVDAFFGKLEQKGFTILKKRVKENALYSLLEFDRVQVRFEAVFTRKENAVIKDYEMVDSNVMAVYTLSPDDLIKEKIAACVKRKKIRDLYDVFFLLRYVTAAPRDLGRIEGVTIADEENLPAIILSGPVPTGEDMRRYIKE